jgi:hypothetical protein
MVILDDGGQYGNCCEGNRWRLISVANRFPSLGAKRNYVLSLVPDGTDGILPIDDDDLFLPWHLSSAARALDIADWSRPSVVLSPQVADDNWIFTANFTGHRSDHRKERLYHPAWAIRLDAIKRVGGYPEELSGNEDQGLMRKLEAQNVSQADPIELGYAPSYIYCWGNQNISGLLNRADPTGSAAWQSLRCQLSSATLHPWIPPFDLHYPMVSPIVRERPF